MMGGNGNSSGMDWTKVVGVAVGGTAVVLSTAYLLKVLLFGSGKNKGAPVFLKERTVKYPVTLVDREDISEDTRRFRFKITPGCSLGLPIGYHCYLSARINGELVVRPYTPVSSERDLGYFDLVIKVYKAGVNERFPEGGKLTQYLENMKIGDTIDCRGPGGLLEYQGRSHFAIKPNKQADAKMFFYRRIGMIAGGTGITPMLQLTREMFHDTDDSTSVSLIFANQTPKDILLRGEIDDLALEHPNRFRRYYTVDRDAPEDWQFGTGFVSEQMMRDNLPPPGDDVLIVMCGPPPMIAACQKNLESIGYKNTYAY